MKKLDKLILTSFIGPFILTFLVVVFILLTQHMLKYFDDIIGKGLGADVIGQLLFYFAIFMTPIAMPLAVLLSSLIAFGNLGEHFELTAIKSAGISLIRALVPIFFFVLVLTGIAFYVNNNLVPKAALEAYSLLYDIKQKKPALDLREGSFYDGIPNMNIKVNKKFPDGVTLKGILIYDHRKNDGNKEVTVADSGKMYTILNERYLKLELFNGYNYNDGSNSEQEMSGQRKRGAATAKTYSRTQFSKMQVVFDLSSFQMTRTDKKWFQGNRIMRNLNELTSDIDSIDREEANIKLAHYESQKNFFTYLNISNSNIWPKEIQQLKAEKDSVIRLTAIVEDSGRTHAAAANPVVKEVGQKPERNPVFVPKKKEVKTTLQPTVNNKQTTVDSVSVNPTQKVPGRKMREGKLKTDSLNRSHVQADEPKPIATLSPKTQNKSTLKAKPKAKKRAPSKPEVKAKPKPKVAINLDEAIDSIFNQTANKSVIDNAASRARSAKNQLMNTQASLLDYKTDRNVFLIQWHKILASSLACVAMFLIGAPLGAIIKKGGLGVPFLVSILFFIIYYLLTMTGEKWAKQGIITVQVGVWAADFILFIVGLIFLRQARLDARLFEADFYSVMLDRAKKWLILKKILKPSAV